MSSEELISARAFCSNYHVELSFIQHLHEAGLIATTIREDDVFLSAGQLPDLERFVRWHYELSINSEGIEALSHVLDRMVRLMDENKALRSRLSRYEHGPAGPILPAVEI